MKTETESEKAGKWENEIAAAALQLIARSGLTDFRTALLWAQWCRSVAMAAQIEDTAQLQCLEGEVLRGRAITEEEIA